MGNSNIARGTYNIVSILGGTFNIARGTSFIVSTPGGTFNTARDTYIIVSLLGGTFNIARDTYIIVSIPGGTFNIARDKEGIEKEKLLVTSNFSFSHSVFYLFGELSAIFNKLEIVVCKLFV